MRTRLRCVRIQDTTSSARRSPTSPESWRHVRPWPHSLQQIRFGNSTSLDLKETICVNTPLYSECNYS